MICEHKSKKLNGSKYCYVPLIIQLNVSHLFTLNLNRQTVLFEAIHHESFVSTQFKCQTVLFDQLGATTPRQSGPGTNEEILHIPQSSNITGASPSDCLTSYQDTRRWEGESYPSAEMHSVDSIALANWAILMGEVYRGIQALLKEHRILRVYRPIL